MTEVEQKYEIKRWQDSVEKVYGRALDYYSRYWPYFVLYGTKGVIVVAGLDAYSYYRALMMPGR